MTGGGSGGHITPILAVASELKRRQPETHIVYIGQKGDALSDIPAQHPAIDEVYSVSAGKFRRYHGAGWRQLLDLPTQFKNLRDGVSVLAGIWQSYWLLRKLRPAVIFTRGGFVSVPVAVGGQLNHVPYITHDSDSVPSLANRIIARWASLHAVALPEDLYPYPRAKTITVGIPLNAAYVPVTQQLQQQYRVETKMADYEQVIFVTGGGNGAQSLNDAVVANAPYLLRKYPKLVLVHLSGRALEAAVNADYDKVLTDPALRQRVIVQGFVTDLYRYSGAADIIICRAGATNLAEFAVQAKPCIVVPAEHLVGGHQTKNAAVMADRGAIILMTQEQIEQERRLTAIIGDLLEDSAKRQALSKAFAGFARTDAAERLALLLLEQATKQTTTHVSTAKT